MFLKGLERQTQTKGILLDEKRIVPATLASCARTMSFQHFYDLSRIYSEILGRFGIDHISINAVPQNGEMLIFSKTPSFAYSLYKTNRGILLDSAISPTFYQTKEYYFWDDCYPKEAYDHVIGIKENKHGFQKGVVFVRKINLNYFLYSFATKSDPKYFVFNVLNSRDLFLQMGDYCLELILPIYEQYADDTMDDILSFLKGNREIPSRFKPKLTMIKSIHATGK